MEPATLFVNAATGVVSSSLTTPVAPVLKVLLGQRLTLRVAFHTAQVIAAITNYTADSMRLAVKKSDDIDSPTSLLPLGAWSVTGSTTATRYEQVVEVDSDQLQTAIGDLPDITLRAQLTWQISTQAEPRLSFPFDLTVVNSPARTDDGAPDTTGAASYAWLVSKLAAGTGLSLTSDTEALVATIAAERSFGRVTADTNAFSGAWTTIFTIPVEAGATYQLDLSIFATLPSAGNMRVVGDLVSGSTAHGFWVPYYSEGTSAFQPYAFNAGVADDLLINVTGSTQLMAARPQRFILITTTNTGSFIIKARSNQPAAGVIRAGSHYILTKLT